MQNQDIHILQTAHNWLANNQPVVLFTVANTWGSSPRPPGSLMALRKDGHVVGSVSGGCVEDDLIGRLTKQEFPTKPGITVYGVDQAQANRFGLPCGGNLRLVYEPFTHPGKLDELLLLLERRTLVTRCLCLADGSVSLSAAHDADTLELNATHFIQTFGPSYRLLIIGAGQLSILLAQIALSLDFMVSICDPRETYLDEWQVPDAVVLHKMPDDAVLDMQPDQRTAIVALSHDPKLDDLALLEALQSPAFYVAALGSRQNNQRRRERLKILDLCEDQIAKLHGPAGLDIGSRTPAEIAVSIAAQLVEAKRRPKAVES